ncbi:hypothetical protein P20652_3344 [Pseudoalteromonas sp. BSi20652]|uniref:hypothetical protein n=1 Tax=Pseudoalteromonas sp. BSi20652 TaxID=388384 RepID=UPI000231B0C8|nr:hypothetical protein [Pseudoalteromonas sp. BSi20652]GAA61465.1 hypothetical protein P20652_3344 [Pseudoalteromonas sp. BSi20652]
MLKQIIPLGVAIALVGCGSSSDSDSSGSVAVSEISTSSSVNFYVSNWQSPQGTLNVLNSDGVVQESIEVDNINTVSVSVTPLTFNSFEFIPSDTRLPCPRFTGCGRTLRGDVNDLNGNRLIDFQETTTVILNYKANGFSAPGVNKVYLSPLSKAITDEGYSAAQASLAATPFYYLTHSNLNTNVEAEMVTNAFTYAAILAGVADSTFSVESAFNAFTNSEADQQAWADYSDLAAQYVTDNLFSDQGNALLKNVVGQVKQTIASVTTFTNWQARSTEVQSLDSRELLVDTRNIIGVARLQEKSYSDELDVKFAELEGAFDEETQLTLNALSNALNEVITNYSPLAEGSTPAGQYKLRDLDIDYSQSPFTWAITGTYDDLPITIDLSIPTFRVSGVLGNKIEGVMSATVTNGATVLNVDVSELLIQFDGIENISELNPEADTGIAQITTNVTINKASGKLEGDLSLNLNRFVNSLGEVSTTLSTFDFNGVYASDIQSTAFHITAIESSPFIGEDNDNLAFTFELDFPLSGASDFKFAYVGDVEKLSELTSTDIFVSIKNRGLDLRIRDVNSNINLIAKGENGRWLDVKQSGRNYSGGLYFGDTKIADVTAVRGIPGVIFPNGEFESLF